jgi:hypothetical protein
VMRKLTVVTEAVFCFSMASLSIGVLTLLFAVAWKVAQ